MPEELKQLVVPMSVYAQAKQLKEQLLDDFCNHTSGLNPLDGHKILCADEIGVISAWSGESSQYSQLKKALDEMLMPTSDLASEYEKYEQTLKAVQARHIERIPLYVEVTPLYGLKNHLLKYKQIMETPKIPSDVRPIGFFNGQRPNGNAKILCTWIRHQALTKILGWIEKIIKSDRLLTDVPDLVLSEEEKTAISSSQMLMNRDFIPIDFDFKAMLSQKEPPGADDHLFFYNPYWA